MATYDAQEVQTELLHEARRYRNEADRLTQLAGRREDASRQLGEIVLLLQYIRKHYDQFNWRDSQMVLPGEELNGLFAVRDDGELYRLTSTIVPGRLKWERCDMVQFHAHVDTPENARRLRSIIDALIALGAELPTPTETLFDDLL